MRSERKHTVLMIAPRLSTRPAELGMTVGAGHRVTPLRLLNPDLALRTESRLLLVNVVLQLGSLLAAALLMPGFRAVPTELKPALTHKLFLLLDDLLQTHIFRAAGLWTPLLVGVGVYLHDLLSDQPFLVIFRGQNALYLVVGYDP